MGKIKSFVRFFKISGSGVPFGLLYTAPPGILWTVFLRVGMVPCRPAPVREKNVEKYNIYFISHLIFPFRILPE